MELPFYLPTSEGRLAAILGVPDRANGTLVVMLTGGSRHGRAHRNRMWVKAARGLEEDGVLTLRMDLPGVGDSEGRPRRFDMENPLGEPVSQAVNEVVRETRVGRVLLMGSCLGARACLAAAPLIPTATDLLYVVAPPLVRKRPFLARAYKAGHWRLTRWVPITKRILPHPARWDPEQLQRLDRPISQRFSRPLLAFTRERGGKVLFLFGEKDPFLGEITTALDRLGRRLPPGSTELQVVPGVELHAFSEIRAQEETIRISSDWVRARLREPIGSAS